ncbi:ArdC family protein [Enterococcus faecium]|uniref:ArdC family protein n=2 Tax=Enterococcus TaxID=1350 RepID=UPI0021585AD8|nr:ArdC family protein [Enterococcus faecium]
MSKFHNYSLNNTLLILMQNPNATHVAGYKTWKNSFNRQVNKGEKSIKIIGGRPYKRKVEEIKNGQKEEKEVEGIYLLWLNPLHFFQSTNDPFPFYSKTSLFVCLLISKCIIKFVIDPNCIFSSFFIDINIIIWDKH